MKKLGFAPLAVLVLMGVVGCVASTPVPSRCPVLENSVGNSSPAAWSARASDEPAGTAVGSASAGASTHTVASAAPSLDPSTFTEVPPDSPALDPGGPPVELAAVQGGPHGSRRCVFHEGVDSYERRCLITKNKDGTLHVEARGTQLNPNHGFTFDMGGGPNQFQVEGKLEAFAFCTGRFSGQMALILNNGAKEYEVRFRNNCKIVVY